jgi:hypothetical protein
MSIQTWAEQMKEHWAGNDAARQRMWNLMAAGAQGEPYTNTLFDIAHNITLTDDELAEREEWVQDLMSRPEADEETFEQDLDNWESNR